MSFVGTEWIVDAAGCRAGALRDAGALDAVFRRVVAELDLKPVGATHWHTFPEPGCGVTGLLMLTESHLACHTYPEYGVATFNLYCCRARPAWPWAERLAEMLGASVVTVRVCERPATAMREAFDEMQARRPFNESDARIVVETEAGDINQDSDGGARR